LCGGKHCIRKPVVCENGFFKGTGRRSIEKSGWAVPAFEIDDVILYTNT